MIIASHEGLSDDDKPIVRVLNEAESIRLLQILKGRTIEEDFKNFTDKEATELIQIVEGVSESEAYVHLHMVRGDDYSDIILLDQHEPDATNHEAEKDT